MYVFMLVATLSILSMVLLFNVTIYIIDLRVFKNAQHLKESKLKITSISRKRRSQNKLRRIKNRMIYTGIPPDEYVIC